MKRIVAFAFIALSLSVAAFAAKNSQDVTLHKVVKVGTVQLPQGSYKVSWTGSDTNAQVTIAKEGKTVVTAPVKIVPAKNVGVSLSTKTLNGSEVLEMIQLEKLDIVLTNATATGE